MAPVLPWPNGAEAAAELVRPASVSAKSTPERKPRWTLQSAYCKHVQFGPKSTRCKSCLHRALIQKDYEKFSSLFF